jgi:hypothetical protein
MKSIFLTLFLFITGVLGLTLLCTAPSSAQQPINATLTFAEYDVIYLADYFDVKNQTLSSNIPGITLELNSSNARDSVFLVINVQVKLQGDNGLTQLLTAYTNSFGFSGTKLITAANLSKSNNEISIRNSTVNEALKKRIQDIAMTIPTVPPGVYAMTMKIYNAKTARPSLTPSGNILGSASQTITVTQSTTEETLVEITDPQNGSWFNNLAPTFSWTTTAQRVIVNVFEVGLNQHSPQDALTGSNPFLSQEVTGSSTLTFPPNAPRKLEQGKAYVVQVEGIVSTNRGDVKRSSKPVTFRITDDKVGRALEQLLNGVGSAAYSTYTTLRSAPSNWVAWPSYGEMTLDGQTISDGDIQTITNALAGKDDVHLTVENQ